VICDEKVHNYKKVWKAKMITPLSAE
jgi:hypothetical protein